jgi:hypothetical protein
MNDSPMQTMLQQRDARPIPGEHLEVLGKRAATSWVTGKCASLHEAVVASVHSERLSPEQVRRVVEFANQDAYQQEFRKEGQHKVVHFDCGPADPAQVLQDLNDGGGGSLYDQGNLDYRMSPSMAKSASLSRTTTTPMDKTASAASEEPAVPGLPKLTKMPSLPKLASPYEDQLWGLFRGEEPSVLPMAEPMGPLVEVRHKLAGAHGELVAEVNQLELDYAEVSDQLYQQVKQAAMDGVSLGDVVVAWSTVNEDPVYVKVAFQMLTPQLRRNGVFGTLDEIGASLQKQAASSAAVNEDHPLVQAYGDFVATLNKLATARSLMAEYAEGLDSANLLLKQAAGGLVGAVGKGLSAASKGIDTAAKPVAHLLVGGKDAKKLAPLLAKGTKLTGGAAALLAGNAAVQNVTDRPAVRGVVQVAKKVVPGTTEYNERRYRNQMGM